MIMSSSLKLIIPPCILNSVESGPRLKNKNKRGEITTRGLVNFFAYSQTTDITKTLFPKPDLLVSPAKALFSHTTLRSPL